MVFEAGMAGVYLGVSGAVPLMSTVDQALPVTPTWLHAAPYAVTWTWLAWRASGKDQAFAPCPENNRRRRSTLSK